MCIKNTVITISYMKCILHLNNIFTRKQNKEKEIENSYQKLKRSWWTGIRTHTWKQNRNISADTAVLLN